MIDPWKRVRDILEKIGFHLNRVAFMIINPSTCNSVANAVMAKLKNETVSTKSLGKITAIAESLYGIGNTSMDSMSKALHRGINPSQLGLYAGRREFQVALNLIKNDKNTGEQAKMRLTDHLENLSKTIDSKIASWERVSTKPNEMDQAIAHIRLNGPGITRKP